MNCCSLRFVWEAHTATPISTHTLTHEFDCKNYFTNINKNETIKMTYGIKLNSFNFCMATTPNTECMTKCVHALARAHTHTEREKRKRVKRSQKMHYVAHKQDASKFRNCILIYCFAKVCAPFALAGTPKGCLNNLWVCVSLQSAVSFSDGFNFAEFVFNSSFCETNTRTNKHSAILLTSWNLMDASKHLNQIIGRHTVLIYFN